MRPDMILALQKAKAGDNDCREYLIQSNTPLVWSIVKRFLNRGHEAEDLFQTGCIGLLKAIDRFDSSYNVCFSTYAVPLITGEIKRFIRDDGIIKVSRSIKELGIKARAVREKMTGDNGVCPTVTQIAEALNVSTEDIVMALDAYTPPESIDAVGENCRPPNEALPAEDVDVTDRIALKEALNSLEPRERQIIVMRFFLDKTQTEISKEIGVSQVQVSRIEKKVLLKMRERLSS